MWSCLDDTMKKIRVLIVDDSALIRKVLTEIINTQHDMEAIGAAPDPLVAREMIRELNPDVLTLDVESAFGGRVVPLRRQLRGQKRAWRDPHRNGQGRRRRNAGNEKRRRLQLRPGRSHLRRVRDAKGGDCGGRGG